MQHPAAKSMIEISRTQDEEVGDGTTSVIILGKTILLLDKIDKKISQVSLGKNFESLLFYYPSHEVDW